MSLRIRLAILVFVPLVFFVTGLFTLNDYGVNGDEPHHFERGQAFLHYFLTGSKNYDNLSELPDSHATRSDDPLATTVFTQRDSAKPRYSVYQDRDFPASLFLESNEMGHPPLNDILAAASNRLFYGQLGWLGDLESYHLFEIAVASLGIALTMWWAYLEFGFSAALFAGIALALHPMYLGESRFNIKDPIETVAYLGALFAIWQLVDNPSSKRYWWWAITAGLFGGLGLGTKFNIVFVVPTVALWLAALGLIKLVRSFRHWIEVRVTRYEPRDRKLLTTHYSLLTRFQRWSGWRVLLGLLIAVGIAASIFYASWPYLWTDSVAHIHQVINYYRGIGIGGIYDNMFLLKNGWDLYPLLDVILRAPLITLMLFAFGLAGFVRYWKTPQLSTLLLWAFWLVIPILRVCVPHTSIYGATRQIMEYLPALALFAGLGASMIAESVTHYCSSVTSHESRRTSRGRSVSRISYFVSRHLSPTNLLITILFLLYALIVITLTRLHPNPQLFYNSLIGGLKGAHEVNFPFWYNTMGNQYAEAIDWLNEHAEPNAKVSLVFNDNWFLPPGRLRPDIHLSTHQLEYFSRYDQAGEYLVSLVPTGTTSWTTDYQSSATRYLDLLVKPIYEYRVDDVTLLRIWRNDHAHQRLGLSISPEPVLPSSVRTHQHTVVLDFGRNYQFAKLENKPSVGNPSTGSETSNCQTVTNGYLSISTDGEQWQRIDNLLASSEPLGYQFSGEIGRFVSIEQEPSSCLLGDSTFRAFTLQSSLDQRIGGDQPAPDQ